MPRIKIKDLPKEQKISKEELKKIMGGITLNLGSAQPTFSIDQMFLKYESSNCIAGVRG
ncbi:MAG: hypothetical protein JRG97_10070 [Deltaproteobacteria bacterium]|nr:hypothetical protein [Deltaproteobacteria bacterium]MBW2051118.1 hypothetical protein [Deltaproteobacteria bacterium]MBW2141400.1 hypothetical protein [Deltaproteobacteria bacterium]MBW2322869.1 hypothetical protein [Deltaproteobacteria bacterium]